MFMAALQLQSRPCLNPRPEGYGPRMTDHLLTRPSLNLIDAPTSPDDHVVLLSPHGSPAGTAIKREVHHANTPLHLAVSCYVVRDDGHVLLTQRAANKRTFPGLWTNACCGHPRPDEALASAVTRHMAHEIGVVPTALRLALPDFAYRAEMSGLVEHELCPVFVAEVSDSALVLNPAEADDAEWVPWPTLFARASDDPTSLSPWSVSQIARLTQLFEDPLTWVRQRPAKSAAPMSRRPAKPRPDPFRRMGRDVDDVVDEFLHSAHLELAILDPLTAELAEPIARLYRAGGKRLRPCFVYCGHAASGAPAAPARENLAYLGAAVEMLHTFALLHDDVMDRSELRRGHPTAHQWFSNLHHPTRAPGGDEWFGNSAAIVAGDLAFVWADELLDRIDVDDAMFRRLRSVFDVLRREVIAGQYLDLRLAGPWATDQQALSVALLKSARYSVTRPLHIGAVLAGADEVTIASLCAYGDAAGIAFQLRDDILGVFGDPNVTGKGNAEDLRSGKASLLLVRALQLAAPADARLLTECLGMPNLDRSQEDRCREAVLASGAVASIEALITANLETAMSALVDLPADVTSDLVELAQQLAHRRT